MIVQDTMIHARADRSNKVGRILYIGREWKHDVLKYLYGCTKLVDGISLLPIIVTLFIPNTD